MGKFIIHFTPTGIIPTNGNTPHVPVSVKEIVNEVLDARKFGVSVIHLQALDEEGNPSWKKETYKEIIDGIRTVDGYTNDSLIICVPTGGNNSSSFESRSESLDLKGASKPDMGSLMLNSPNLPDPASINSPEMIQKLAVRMKANNIKPVLEIYNIDSINFAKYLYKNGLIKPPFYFSAIFGNIPYISSEMLEAGNLIKHLPEDSYWSFGGIGNAQLKMNTMAILNGGGIQIGLGDNIYFDNDHRHLASNKDLLDRINEIATLLDSAPFTPAEVRKMLNLEIE